MTSAHPMNAPLDSDKIRRSMQASERALGIVIKDPKGKLALPAAATKRLNRGVTLYTEFVFDDEARQPIHVALKLDFSALSDIVRRVRFAMIEGPNLAVVSFSEPDDYSRSQGTVESWSMHHNGDAFHFEGKNLHGVSEQVSLTDLFSALELGCHDEASATVNNCAWLGDALFYDRGDPQVLLDRTAPHIPTLAAQLRERDMASVIDASVGAGKPVGPKPRRTRHYP